MNKEINEIALQKSNMQFLGYSTDSGTIIPNSFSPRFVYSTLRGRHLNNSFVSIPKKKGNKEV